MPRKPKSPSTDAFAAQMAATFRPLVQQLVREAFAEMLIEWAAKNAPKAAAAEPERAPEPVSVGKGNGATKRAESA